MGLGCKYAKYFLSNSTGFGLVCSTDVLSTNPRSTSQAKSANVSFFVVFVELTNQMSNILVEEMRRLGKLISLPLQFTATVALSSFYCNH